MSDTIDNIIDYITIEITAEKSKNIMISCIYRTPGTCLDIFNKKLASMFENLNKGI